MDKNEISKIIQSLQFEITTINSTIKQLSKVQTHDNYSYANVNNSIDNLKYTKQNLERIVNLLNNQELAQNSDDLDIDNFAV